MTRALVVAELPQRRPVTRLTEPSCRRVDPTHELERVAQRGLLGRSIRPAALRAARARGRRILRLAQYVAIPEMPDATRNFFVPLARGPTRRAWGVPVILAKHPEELQAPQSSDGPRLERCRALDDFAEPILDGPHDVA